MLLQRGNTQRPAANPRATGTIILDSPAASPLPRFGHTYQTSSQQPQQGRTGGVRPQQLNNQQPAGSQAGHQTRTLPRFGPDYRAPSGFSPCRAPSGFSPFRAASSSARPDSMAAQGNSLGFWSPSQLSSGLASPGTGTDARSLSAHPHSKLLDELMEDLSMHQPYDPLAPLPAVSTTQQSSVSTADAVEMDVDAVIARYAVNIDHGKASAYSTGNICCLAEFVYQCLCPSLCDLCLVFQQTGRSVQLSVLQKTPVLLHEQS